jgi:hypothetical protein
MQSVSNQHIMYRVRSIPVLGDMQSMQYMNKIVSKQEAFSMVQHQDLHVVPWYKPRPFVFGFNKVSMTLNMIQCKF